MATILGEQKFRAALYGNRENFLTYLNPLQDLKSCSL